MDELEFDLSEFTWETSNDMWFTSDVDIDISDFAWEEQTEDTSNSNSSEQEWWESQEWWEWSDSNNNEWGNDQQGDDKSLDDELAKIDELLKDLDEDQAREDDSYKAIIDTLKSVEWSDEAIAMINEMRLENQTNKSTIKSLNDLVKKLTQEKNDSVVRAAELELYGNLDDTQLVYLNGNLTKARSWDDKAKKRIIWILDSIRWELAWKTLEDEENADIDNKLNTFSSYNDSKLNWNFSWKWWLDDVQIDL